MAIIRQRRAAAIQRRYTHAALVYLVVGAIVVGTSYLPGMTPPGMEAAESPIVKFAPWLFVLVATLVIWRALRSLSVLILIFTLFQAAVHLLDGLGTHFRFAAEADAPATESLTDTVVLRAFFNNEMATDTPFYETANFERVRIAASDVLSKLPVPEGLVESAGDLGVGAAIVSYFNTALLIMVCIMLWRAIRVGSPRTE